MALKEQIQSYIVECFLLGDATDLEPEQSLLESGVVDSTGILELVMFLEETYHIEVADKEMVPENLDSIANISAFVERKLNGRTPDTGGTA